MKTVRIRELKNRLSAYVRSVKKGESLLVTEHGQVVAEISPPRSRQKDPRSAGLDALVRRGLLRRSATQKGEYPSLPRATKGITSTELLDFERGNR